MKATLSKNILPIMAASSFDFSVNAAVSKWISSIVFVFFRVRAPLFFVFVEIATSANTKSPKSSSSPSQLSPVTRVSTRTSPSLQKTITEPYSATTCELKILNRNKLQWHLHDRRCPRCLQFFSLVSSIDNNNIALDKFKHVLAVDCVHFIFYNECSPNYSPLFFIFITIATSANTQSLLLSLFLEDKFNFNDESACDGSTCACEKGQTKLTVEVKTDVFSWETAYEIKNSAGVVVIQNDEFDDTNTFTTSYCLHGCDGYSFTMLAPLRNGNGNNGYYKLTINDDSTNAYTGGTGTFSEEIVVLSDEFTCPAVTSTSGPEEGVSERPVVSALILLRVWCVVSLFVLSHIAFRRMESLKKWNDAIDDILTTSLFYSYYLFISLASLTTVRWRLVPVKPPHTETESL